MTNINIESGITGRVAVSHYRRGQLINECGDTNTITNDWIRWGLSGLLTDATLNTMSASNPPNLVDIKGTTIKSAVPTWIEMVYKNPLGNDVYRSLAACSGGGDTSDSSDYISNLQSPTGSALAPRNGGVIVTPDATDIATNGGSGYFNDINQGETNLNFNVNIYSGGTVSNGFYQAGEDGVVLASITNIPNTTRIITGDDVLIKYENVLSHHSGSDTSGTGNNPDYGGLTVDGAIAIARAMTNPNLSTSTNLGINNVLAYQTGDKNTYPGFGNPIDFDLTIGTGNTTTGDATGTSWPKRDFDCSIGDANAVLTAERASVAIQKSRTVFSPSAVTGAVVRSGNIDVCTYPGIAHAGSTDTLGYVAANSGKRHSLRVQISISNATFGYTW